MNSGPTRNAGSLVGWNQCKNDPCFLIRAAYDEDGSKKDLPDLQVPTGFLNMKRSGFTLIELLVVLAILIILSVLALIALINLLKLQV